MDTPCCGKPPLQSTLTRHETGTLVIFLINIIALHTLVMLCFVTQQAYGFEILCSRANGGLPGFQVCDPSPAPLWLLLADQNVFSFPLHRKKGIHVEPSGKSSLAASNSRGISK